MSASKGSCGRRPGRPTNGAELVLIEGYDGGPMSRIAKHAGGPDGLAAVRTARPDADVMPCEPRLTPAARRGPGLASMRRCPIAAWTAFVPSVATRRSVPVTMNAGERWGSCGYR